MISAWVCRLVEILAIVLAMLWWINGARLRRMRPYRKRDLAPEAWADDRFLRCLEKGFAVPPDLARRFRPDDTVMAIYLTLYPEHCTYDNLELKRLLREFRRVYAWTPADDAWVARPLGELFKAASKQNG